MQRRGKKRRKSIVVVPMMRYAKGRQRGKMLPGRRPKGVVEVLTSLKKTTKTKTKDVSSLMYPWPRRMGTTLGPT